MNLFGVHAEGGNADDGTAFQAEYWPAGIAGIHGGVHEDEVLPEARGAAGDDTP